MKEEDKLKLKQQLIELYSGYIKNMNDNIIRQNAQKLFFEYIYTNDITEREFLTAIHGLEHIGWEFSRGLQVPNVNWKMNEKDAREILEKLK